MNIRVSLVEDEEEIRNLTAMIINYYADLKCVAQYPNAEKFIAEFDQVNPDIVLMDIDLPGGMSGLDCIREMKQRSSGTQYIMFTAFNNPEKIIEALSVGAVGYVLKGAPPEKSSEAIRAVHSGGGIMSPEVARLLAESFQQKHSRNFALINKLSEREQEVLYLLRDGLTYEKIKAELNISIDTVGSHIRNIYDKLEVHNRTDAVNKVFGK